MKHPFLSKEVFEYFSRSGRLTKWEKLSFSSLWSLKTLKGPYFGQKRCLNSFSPSRRLKKWVKFRGDSLKSSLIPTEFGYLLSSLQQSHAWFAVCSFLIIGTSLGISFVLPWGRAPVFLHGFFRAVALHLCLMTFVDEYNVQKSIYFLAIWITWCAVDLYQNQQCQNWCFYFIFHCIPSILLTLSWGTDNFFGNFHIDSNWVSVFEIVKKFHCMLGLLLFSFWLFFICVSLIRRREHPGLPDQQTWNQIRHYPETRIIR